MLLNLFSKLTFQKLLSGTLLKCHIVSSVDPDLGPNSFNCLQRLSAFDKRRRLQGKS